MTNCQSGILSEITPFALYLELDANTEKTAQITTTLKRIATVIDGKKIIMGIGSPIATALCLEIPGLRTFTPFFDPSGKEIIPASQAGLFLQIRGQTINSVLATEKEILAKIEGSFTLIRRNEAFRFAGGRDLTGYEDGTENPEGDAVVAAVCMDLSKLEFDGSCILTLQKWVHDLNFFRAMDPDAQDEVFGRRIMDNSEIDDGPVAAHVKRTEQESFSPEAIILRRSMMWSNDESEGMMFTSYSSAPRPFDVQMQRMVGMEDGIVDNLFKYSCAISGAFYWCPPVHDNQIYLNVFDANH